MLIGKLEAELGERSTQVDALTAQVNEAQAEKSQLVEKVASVNSLLASQADKAEDDKVNCSGCRFYHINYFNILCFKLKH